ncbi:MAG TPA: glycoside hydrolase family 3 C-terminal domain-containing protein [Candidatus Acidoferrales bacterium]
MIELTRRKSRWIMGLIALIALSFGGAAIPAWYPIAAQYQSPEQQRLAAEPWMNKSLSPNARADLLVQQMTLDEKIQMVHGVVGGQGSLGGAGFVPGIPHLGIPGLQMTDGRSGVANSGLHGRYATALPSALANAASWDVKSAYQYGALLGKEVRELGFNVSLGGTSNLIREPRNGRNFECLGEDPILIGKMLGQELKGTQDQKVIGNINRYVANDQETGRLVGNVVIDKRALQETDLLAFKIAIKESGVGTVMCAYNRLNGVYTCENPYVIDDVLKKSWGFAGWVMSDWGATHSTVPSALAGFDQEMPDGRYYGDALKQAVEDNQVPTERLDDMVHRILRTEIALGVFDAPATPQPVNPFADAEVAQQIEERGIVLLKNANNQLPLSPSKIKSIAVIGGHADVGVISGGGSDQVSPAGGNAVHFAPPLRGGPPNPSYQPSSPLNAIRAEAPAAQVQYDPGTDPSAAAQLAAKSTIALVFVTQPAREGADVRSLSLPDNQDELISKVAAANRHVIVVVESGGPVLMPWIDSVSGVLEAWFPGIRGGEAVANVLFGGVDPSGRLPVTFPKSEADIPHAQIFGMDLLLNPGYGSNEPGGRGRGAFPPFDIDYTEGLKVGYKWYEAENKQPLFPFGYGLSYTTFSFSKLKTTASADSQISFDVTNKGKRAGEEVAQVYVELPQDAGEPFKRLVAWEKIQLSLGETKPVTISLDPQYLSIFDVNKEDWYLVPGDYKVYVGGSSEDLPLNGTIAIKASN